MEIRPATPADLDNIEEIDGTIESSRYIYVDRSGSGSGITWKTEERALRQKLILANPLGDERKFTLKQITTGADEGAAIVADYDGHVLAMAMGKPNPELDVYTLIDVRVDADYRRQGMASALMYQLVQAAREADLRAIAAEVKTNNYPATELMVKLGFELAGIDTQRHSQHDLVKETVTLFWYLPLVR